MNLHIKSVAGNTRTRLSKFKEKERILKAAREKWLIKYKETSIRLSADFLADTLQVRREGDDTFKVLGKKQNETKQKTMPTKNTITVKAVFQK